MTFKSSSLGPPRTNTLIGWYGTIHFRLQQLDSEYNIHSLLVYWVVEVPVQGM